MFYDGADITRPAIISIQTQRWSVDRPTETGGGCTGHIALPPPPPVSPVSPVSYLSRRATTYNTSSQHEKINSTVGFMRFFFSFLAAFNMKGFLFILSTRKFPSFFLTMNILNSFQIRYEVNMEKFVSCINFI